MQKALKKREGQQIDDIWKKDLSTQGCEGEGNIPQLECLTKVPLYSCLLTGGLMPETLYGGMKGKTIFCGYGKSNLILTPG